MNKDENQNQNISFKQLLMFIWLVDYDEYNQTFSEVLISESEIETVLKISIQINENAKDVRNLNYLEDSYNKI